MSAEADIRLVLREIFGTPSGRALAAWLDATVLSIEPSPTLTDAEVRHHIGRRSLARQLLNLARETG